MHKLYLLLKPCLPEKEEAYLLDEIDAMLKNSKGDILLKSLEIIYKNKYDKKTSLELLILFVSGLKSVNFFEYANFAKGINGKT